MTVTYCTAAQVAAYLQRAAFSGSTTPTSTIVEGYINQAESEINRHTGTAWMPVTVTNEIHRMDYRPSRNVKQWRPQVALDYRPIRTLTVSTDKIEVYNGSSWVEWVATKTEGRNDDFWVDYANGIIFFEKGYPIYPFNEGVRLTYRYGHSTVAGWVQELAIMMAALRVIEFDRTRMIAAGGSGGNPDKPTTDGSIISLKSQIKDKLDEATWLTNQDRRPFMVV